MRETRALAHTTRSLRISQAQAIKDVKKKIQDLETLNWHSKRLPEWRAVLIELEKPEYI